MLSSHLPSTRFRTVAPTTARPVDASGSTTKAVTSLWTVRKDAQRIDAELMDHGQAGWELRMSKNHAWMSGHRFSDRANAIAHGEAIRRDLEQRDWRE
jgi:hypothetical protein